MTTASPVVLVVDDEEGLRSSIAFDFKRKKFKVVEAACGNDAIEILKKQQIDLVLSDVRMPNGNGLELLDWIKSQDTNLPVLIFITAHADISVAEAYDRGADAIFSKPFDRQALFEAAMRAICPPTQRLKRKRGTRVEAQFPVEIQAQQKDGMELRGSVRNIGRGGAFIETVGAPPEAGTRVSFSLELEPGLVIQGYGVIRWRKEGPSPGCGVEFLELGENGREVFAERINALKTKSFIPSR